MNGRMTAERRTGELATPIGDHFINVHVELRATARHPNMQGEHLVMLARENFIARLHDQFIALIIEPFAMLVGDGGGLLQGGVGRDHFTGDQVSSDTEMLERALGLRTPKLLCWYFNDAEAVPLFSHFRHGTLLFSEWVSTAPVTQYSGNFCATWLSRRHPSPGACAQS